MGASYYARGMISLPHALLVICETNLSKLQEQILPFVLEHAWHTVAAFGPNDA